MNETFTKKDLLAKRLTGYAAAAGAMVALVPDTDGQVIYSGLVDTLATENVLNLDLDNNGTDDFRFSLYEGVFTSGNIWGRNASIYLYAAYKTTYDSTFNYFRNSFIQSYGNDAAALNRGFLVGNNLPSATNSVSTFNWRNESFDTVASVAKAYSRTYTVSTVYTNSYTYFNSQTTTNTLSSYQSGNFLGAGEKYLGVRFYIEDNLHYGWIRLEVPSDASELRVYDWAYQAVADSAIYAGDSIDLAANLSVNDETFVNDPVTVELEFNKMAYGLELSDFEVINGTASDLTLVSPMLKIGGPVGEVFTLTITPLEPGEVKVILPDSTVSDEFGQQLMAADTVTFHWDIETNIDEISSLARVYPVPTRDRLIAEASITSDFTLINLDGKVLEKQMQTLNAIFDLSGMQPGLLIVEVRNQQGIARYKVVKE